MRGNELFFKPHHLKDLMVGDVTFRSCYDRRLTKFDLEQARLELGETEDRMKESLRKLKESLINDRDFRYRLDDEYLLRFLRYRKYDDEKAFRSVRDFYKLRNEMPRLFDLPPKLEFFLRRDLVRCLPYRNEEGCIIFWIDSSQWDLDEMSFWDTLVVAHAVADVITMNPGCQINGTIGIWDLGGLTVRHALQYAYPSVVKTFFKCMQSTYPWRIKLVFAVNCNRMIRGFYQAFRYLMQKKIADRVVLLGSDYSELQKYINPRLLPKRYGGCIETSECSIVETTLDNLPYIKYERSFGPNPSVLSV